MNEKELILIIKRFRNFCNIFGWSSKSFKTKVNKVIKGYENNQLK